MIIMNQNTSPISPFKPEHYKRASESISASQYPEVELDRFKAIYGKLSGLDPKQMELANGSDEWIQKLMIVFGLDGGALTLNPDFFMYKDYADQFGVDIQYVEADDNYDFHIEDILNRISEVKPKMFIFSNPQNPTAYQFEEEDIQKMADAMEAIDGYLVIDEAYIDFGRDYKRPQGDHVVLLRSMSKIYGMAGMRIGIMYATGSTYDKITKINHPYPLNSLVLNTASEFLEDEVNRKKFLAYQHEAKAELVKAMDLVSDIIPVKPSESNFIFTYGDLAIELGRFLEKNGYLLRFYEEEDLQDVVRYSILALDEYPAFVTAIKEWRGQL